MDRHRQDPPPPPDPEAGSSAVPDEDDGPYMHQFHTSPSSLVASDWSDSDIAAADRLEEDQDQLYGLPAYDDVLDLIVLDVDDDDLGDDDEPTSPTAPTLPRESAVSTTVEGTSEPASASASRSTCGTPDGPPPPQPHHEHDEYHRGLGKRLEQFAPLADPGNQAHMRDRLDVIAIARNRVANATVARRDSGTPICRICRDTYPYGVGADEDKGEVDDAEDAVDHTLTPTSLVSPCDCRGTVARVHMSCLERWLAESDSSCCELCGHQYTTIRTPSYGVLASIPAWIIHNGSVDMLFDFVAFLIFTPVTLFGTTLGLGADDSPYFQAYCIWKREVKTQNTAAFGMSPQVSIMAALDLVYSAWLAMRLHYHAHRWYSWWRRKSTVKVILDENEEEKKNRQAGS